MELIRLKISEMFIDLGPPCRGELDETKDQEENIDHGKKEGRHVELSRKKIFMGEKRFATGIEFYPISPKLTERHTSNYFP